MKGKTITIIMNCPNRWGKLFGSLAALLSQKPPLQVKLAVHLVDDTLALTRAQKLSH